MMRQVLSPARVCLPARATPVGLETGFAVLDGICTVSTPSQSIPNDACWRLYQAVALACRDSSDLPSLLTTALGFCLQLRDVGAGCVHRVDHDGSLSLVSQSGFEPTDGRILGAPIDSELADVVRGGRPVYVQRGDPELEGDEHFTALATLPVAYGQRAFAVLTVASRTVEMFPEPIRAVLETIVAQLAPALANLESSEVAGQQASREATRLESAGVLAGGVARGLHHLLVSADLQADRLLELAGDDSALRNLAADLSRATTDGRGLSKQLESAAAFVAEPTLLDPAAFVVALRETLVRLLGDPIELRIQVQPTDFRLRMDRRQLQQIIASLTLLSRDTMPEGGRLTIEMRAGTAADGRPYMALTLRDTGPIEDRAELANSMVGDLVRMLQGEIRIFAGEVGTVSEVKLPFESVSDAAIGKEVVAAAEGEVTILVLEADVRLRQLAASALRRAGYRAIETNEAREALRLARDEGQRIDLVLADVRLARGGRWDLLQKLAAVRPEVNLLYMAAMDRETRKLLDPSVTFLAKPFSITGVIRMVRAALVDAQATTARSAG
jgi:CheY-like chemotaxis protein